MTYTAHLYNNSIQSGTAQAGGANTITLASAASSVDGAYVECHVAITGGLGSGQVGLIQAYAGSTRIATITANWSTQPNNTSTYTIYQYGQWTAGLDVVSASRMDHIESDVTTASTEIVNIENGNFKVPKATNSDTVATYTPGTGANNILKLDGGGLIAPACGLGVFMNDAKVHVSDSWSVSGLTAGSSYPRNIALGGSYKWGFAVIHVNGNDGTNNSDASAFITFGTDSTKTKSASSCAGHSNNNGSLNGAGAAAYQGNTQLTVLTNGNVYITNCYINGTNLTWTIYVGSTYASGSANAQIYVEVFQ